MIDPVAALTAVLPEEHDAIQPQPVRPAKLDGLAPRQSHNTLPRTVALAGSGAALGLLGWTLMIVHAIKRSRRPS